LTRPLTVFCWLLLPWLSAASAAAEAAAAVRHELSFPQRHNQYVHVRSTWPAGDAPLELAMPSWTPGSYLIRDYAAHVEDLRVRTADGRVAEARKVAKNRWLIEPGGAREVTVEYDVWAN
jgi:predicted metalloprotease with PDZ domain